MMSSGSDDGNQAFYANSRSYKFAIPKEYTLEGHLERKAQTEANYLATKPYDQQSDWLRSVPKEDDGIRYYMGGDLPPYWDCKPGAPQGFTPPPGATGVIAQWSPRELAPQPTVNDANDDDQLYVRAKYDAKHKALSALVGYNHDGKTTAYQAEVDMGASQAKDVLGAFAHAASTGMTPAGSLAMLAEHMKITRLSGRDLAELLHTNPVELERAVTGSVASKPKSVVTIGANGKVVPSTSAAVDPVEHLSIALDARQAIYNEIENSVKATLPLGLLTLGSSRGMEKTPHQKGVVWMISEGPATNLIYQQGLLGFAQPHYRIYGKSETGARLAPRGIPIKTGVKVDKAVEGAEQVTVVSDAPGSPLDAIMGRSPDEPKQIWVVWDPVVLMKKTSEGRKAIIRAAVQAAEDMNASAPARLNIEGAAAYHAKVADHARDAHSGPVGAAKPKVALLH